MYSLSDRIMPVACARPDGDHVITDRRLRRFTERQLRRLEAEEEAYRRSIVEQVTSKGYYPGRGERIVASVESEGLRRAISVRFGCRTRGWREDCVSRSYSRAKEPRRQLRRSCGRYDGLFSA